MSWLKKLAITYDEASALSEHRAFDKPLLPVAHTNQTAHIKAVIDITGRFIRAEVLNKFQIMLPATEKSASRARALAPHPLADKIMYVAKDYPVYKGAKESGFELYFEQLKEWARFTDCSDKVQAVFAYIQKGTVVSDLINHKICHVNDSDELLTSWDKEENDGKEAPELLKLLPKEKGKLDQGSALVCWEVLNCANGITETWNDYEVAKSWSDFLLSKQEGEKLCSVTGELNAPATNHPSKIRHSGDKAKLISSNDTSGFTFRGRVTDRDNVATVSSLVTQKAHSALAWLIANQPKGRTGDQHLVCWADSLNKAPDPLGQTISFFDDDEEEDTPVEPIENLLEGEQQFGLDLGARFANRLQMKQKGYFTGKDALEADETITIMVVDSATPGRMGISYYREFFAQDYIQQLVLWHKQFAWPQRLSNEQKLAGVQTFENTRAPSPRDITLTAYGDVLKSNESFSKSLIERLLPCVADGQQIPVEFVNRSITNASKPLATEIWEWERNLSVACALYRGFHARSKNLNINKEYKMALDNQYSSRDYLFGRLLAVADNLENRALDKTHNKRPTTALRLMQRFAQYPAATWPIIYSSLNPYIQQLMKFEPGFVDSRITQIDQISNLFKIDEFSSNAPLSGEYLLGFHCQRSFLLQKKSSSKVSTKNNELADLA